MGSSASIGNNRRSQAQLPSGDFSEEIPVDDLAHHIEETVVEDCSGVILSIHDYSRIQSSKFTADVFLAYDSSPNNFILSLRVGEINSALRKRGLRTFFADELLNEDLTPQNICNAIDESKLVVVFITEMYVRNVGILNSNISTEFFYASEQKTSRRMLPVVMESGVRDPLQWRGKVGLVLGGSSSVDFSIEEDTQDTKNDALFARIVHMIGPPIQFTTTPPPPPLPSSSSELSWANLFIDPASRREEEEQGKVGAIILDSSGADEALLEVTNQPYIHMHLN